MGVIVFEGFVDVDVGAGASFVVSEVKWTSSMCRVRAVSLSMVKGQIGQLSDMLM